MLAMLTPKISLLPLLFAEDFFFETFFSNYFRCWRENVQLHLFGRITPSSKNIRLRKRKSVKTFLPLLGKKVNSSVSHNSPRPSSLGGPPPLSDLYLNIRETFDFGRENEATCLPASRARQGSFPLLHNRHTLPTSDFLASAAKECK